MRQLAHYRIEKEADIVNAPRVGTVTADTLNVRPTPSTKQAPIAQLHRGKVVPVRGQTGDWYEIDISGCVGFVAARYLQIEEAQAILFPDLFHGDANGHPDWTDLARTSSFFGAIVKATEGVSYPRGLPWFSKQWHALRDAGEDRYGNTWFRGCYHYLIMSDSGARQARFYLRAVEDAGGWGDGDLPPSVDVERGQEGSNNFCATKQQVIDVTSEWSEIIHRELGRKTMLYGRGAMRDLGITDHMGCDYLWAPRYAKVLGRTIDIGWPAEQVKLWQYTDGKANFTGYPHKAPGIGCTDMSIFLGTLEDLRVLVTDSPVTPEGRH